MTGLIFIKFDNVQIASVEVDLLGNDFSNINLRNLCPVQIKVLMIS